MMATPTARCELEEEEEEEECRGEGPSLASAMIGGWVRPKYRVTHLLDENLPLT